MDHFLDLPDDPVASLDVMTNGHQKEWTAEKGNCQGNSREIDLPSLPTTDSDCSQLRGLDARSIAEGNYLLELSPMDEGG